MSTMSTTPFGPLTVHVQDGQTFHATTTPPTARHFLGLDLGQANDYSALVVVRQLPVPESPRHYEISHLERVPLNTPYPAVVARMVEVCALPILASRRGYCTVVADYTGVGRPVVDLLREADLSGAHLVPISITSGVSVNDDGYGGYHVPKRDLVGTVAVLLQNERLKIAKALPEAQLLVHELLNFKYKLNPTTGSDQYAAWREREHDDLVLAAALALWRAEHGAAVWIF